MRKPAYFRILFLAASFLLNAASYSAADTAKLSKFERAIIDLRCDDAIRLLAPSLNRALSKGDYKCAAKILRVVALAFKLDDNDDAAVQAMELATKLDPSDEHAGLQLAEYLFRDGRWSDADKILEKLSKSSDPQISQKSAAFLAQQKGSIVQAISLLEVYAKKYPDDHRALMRLSFLYVMDDDKPKAALVEQKLSELSPSQYFKEICLGKASEYAGDSSQAESHYQKAGEYNKEDPLWHCHLALMFMKQHKIKEADLEFKKCFESRRLIGRAFTNWAILESFFGNKAEAKKCLAYLQNLRPNSNELYFVRGIIEENNGESDKASADFKHSIELYPHNSSPYIHLLQSKEYKSDSSKRIELCRKWSLNCPQSAIAVIELGKAFQQSGNDDYATINFLRAKLMLQGRAMPEDMNYRIAICTMHAQLAGILYKRKEMDRALEEAAKFNALRPPTARTAGIAVRPPKIDLAKLKDKKKQAAEHALFADALYECGMLNDAEREYKSALVDDPDNIDFHSALLKVLIDKKDYLGAAKEDAAVSQHVITHIGDLFGQKPSKRK